MIYMKADTYDLTDSYDYEEKNNYIVLDPGIAPSISILNKKGYFTKFCCEGHPYVTSEYYSGDDSMERYIREDKEDIHNCISYPGEFYVMFDKDYTGHFIKTLPEMFCIEYERHLTYVTGKVIDQDERCSIKLSKAYTFSNKNRMLSFEKSYDILKEINESFYYWVVSLPKLEEEKKDN